MLFGGRDLEGLSADDLLDIFAEVPSSELAAGSLSGAGINVVDLALEAGLDRSKKQVRDLIKNGGLYLNNRAVDDPDRAVTRNDAIDGRVIVLRKGKKNYHLVRV